MPPTGMCILEQVAKSESLLPDRREVQDSSVYLMGTLH
jgi:hypothetical protein